MREELLEPGRRSRSRPPRRRRCGRGGSTSSSASPRLREHLEIMSTRGAAARAGRRPRAARGPPGLGKTTLAGIIATEMGARMQPTSGPALERAGDLAAILTTSTTATCCSSTRSTGLPRVVEEVLYPAMEDFQLDIVIGKGPIGAHDPPRPAALHARGRDDAHRVDHRPAARPLRLRRPPRLLRRSTSSPRSCAAPRTILGVRARRRRRVRDRVREPAARRASRTGC